MTQGDDPIRAALDRLRRPLRLTSWGMTVERVAQAFWPVMTLVLACAAFLAFGLQDFFVLEVLWAGGGLALLGMIAGIAQGVRRFRWPRPDEALDRLDDSLSGHPLRALQDSPAVGSADTASAAVWREHQKRMADRAASARAVPPRPQLARRDPYGLRLAALTAAVLAGLFGAPTRLAEITTLAPRGETAMASGPSWEGWIKPPSYTGRPTLYLNALETQALSVPEGSNVSLRLYGAEGDLSVRETVSKAGSGAEGGDTRARRDFGIARDGTLGIEGPGGRSWNITVTPDAAPGIRPEGAPERQAGGRMQQSFSAWDDYGVVAATARIELDLEAVDRHHGLAVAPEPREPARIELPMPRRGDGTEISEALVADLSRHPWANLPVRITLVAEDARGQTGRSDSITAVLPGRRFFEPMAAAVAELRRDLLWNRATAPRVLRLMRAITHRPEGDPLFDNERGYLMLRVAMRELDAALQDDGEFTAERRDDLAEALWDIAVLLEDGDLADARERLERAQERLSEAMRRGADDAEIAELMQEMREAMREFTRQLGQQAPAEEGGPESGSQGMQITQQQLDQLLDRIQQLMEEGRMAEASELMAQLSRMLENMRVARGENGEDGQPGPGGQAMEGLGETLREQRRLSDETFRQHQDRFGSGGGDLERRDGRSGEGPSGNEAPGSLAERQRALREELRRQQDQALPGEGTPEGEATREALERGERAMERAEEALREGDAARALDGQADALDALRDGMRSMGDAMAREQGDRQGQQGRAEGAAPGRDPLGREAGRLGRGDETLPGGNDGARRRELLDELRRRSGQRDRPQVELDYLMRLLDRF